MDYELFEWAVCASCGNDFKRKASEQWKRLCLQCYIAKKQAEETETRHTRQSKPSPEIEEDMLRRLIYLCHPDKHNNSQASVLATQWLLKQRK